LLTTYTQQSKLRKLAALANSVRGPHVIRRSVVGPRCAK